MLFDENETMKMLGKQPYIIPDEMKEEVASDISNVISAYTKKYPIYGNCNGMFSMCACVFNLGYIYRKRKERSKRAKFSPYKKEVLKMVENIEDENLIECLHAFIGTINSLKVK